MLHDKTKLQKKKILELSDIPSMADILKEKGLQWLGHVHRTNKNAYPDNYCILNSVKAKKLLQAMGAIQRYC